MSSLPPILGHGPILEHLLGAAVRGTLHHAYLFEGPAGVGKATVALRLALAANCEADDRPCGDCPSCRRILTGVHPDVISLEPDPKLASRTIPVAAIRDVIRTTGFHRFDARRRFVIVDPAEALQPAAANALLKTLEEPPEGTGFILIANHATALLPTIVSRCQRVRFGPVPLDALEAWLAERGIERPARAARLSLGCPGEALALAEGRLEARQSLREELLETLAGDLGGIFQWSEKLCKGSRADWSPRVTGLIDLLEELLRDVVVVASGAPLPLFHNDAQPVVERWTDALWPDGVVRLEAAVHEARDNLAHNVSGKTLVDALVTRVATELGSARKG